MKKMNRIRKFNRFILAFIAAGIIPVLFIGFYSGVLFHGETYRSMEESYRQTAVYGVGSLDIMIERYNTVSKFPYSYNPEYPDRLSDGNGLRLARLLKETGNTTAEELKRRKDINDFLWMALYSDIYITGVVFVEANGEHYAMNRNGNIFIDSTVFEKTINRTKEALPANKMILIPTHEDSYFLGAKNTVFTVGRNYMDISFPMGYEEVIGTFYIDVSVKAIDDHFRQLDVYHSGSIVVTDRYDNI
ncbi:MAG: cache domain-containing protein, partial [Treponema sp.]|nr:cache domain-containing protein [Treponema sp.]